MIYNGQYLMGIMLYDKTGIFPGKSANFSCCNDRHVFKQMTRGTIFFIFHAHFCTLLKCENYVEILNTLMYSLNHGYKTILKVEYNIWFSCNDRHIFNISRNFLCYKFLCSLEQIQFLQTLRDI